MTRIALCLLTLLAAACANPMASTEAPTGIKQSNGGGERTLGNVGVSGPLSTTVVR